MFHKEGFKIIAFSFLVSSSLVISFEILINSENIKSLFQILTLIQFLLILWFFRNPKRDIIKNSELILSPADGKIVVINKVEENEFFKDKRIQVSIFMSPINVHVNRYPIDGTVKYAKYHPGKYLVAWHPKSSTENERTSVVVKNESISILFRQIAGALARRIVMYSKVNDKAIKGEDYGFIKFGSRVDLFFPLGTQINVELNEKVKGNKTIIAKY